MGTTGISSMPIFSADAEPCSNPDGSFLAACLDAPTPASPPEAGPMSSWSSTLPPRAQPPPPPPLLPPDAPTNELLGRSLYSAFRLFLRLKRTTATMAAMSAASPPMTPPAMAPVLDPPPPVLAPAPAAMAEALALALELATAAELEDAIT